MDKYLNVYGQPIKIAHFPGDSKYLNKQLLNKFKWTPITVPDNIKIITIATSNIENSSPLLQQLKTNNIPYINVVPQEFDQTHWINSNKIQLISECLEQISTEYVLLLDALDVAILDNLDCIIDLYKSYNVEVLYNGTVNNYPSIEIEEIPNRDELGTWGFFNAGCCIGKTEALKQIYAEALEMVNNPSEDDLKHKASEQYFIRKVYAKHVSDGLIGVDYQCKIFQVWHFIKVGKMSIIDGVPTYQLINSKRQSPTPLTPQPAVETDIV